MQYGGRAENAAVSQSDHQAPQNSTPVCDSEQNGKP